MLACLGDSVTATTHSRCPLTTGTKYLAEDLGEGVYPEIQV